MTTQRPQIILEGSRDGENWLPYKFKYQPDDLDRPPLFVAPHQPRLDWQLWFAALRGEFRRKQWFVSFAIRLVQGSPQVTGLLAEDPFPAQLPLYVRAVLYDYRFTTRSERAGTGHWWRRVRLGIYMPPMSIRK